VIGHSNTQFCFDVLQDCGEVMIDLMQKNSNQFVGLGFQIYKVEMNRNYKIHNLNAIDVTFTAEPLKIRNVFKRIELNFGRYVLIPMCSNQELELLLRLHTTKPSNLKYRIAKHRDNYSNFFYF
jgi:calpain-6